MPPFKGAQIGLISLASAAARESAQQLLARETLGPADTPGAAMERAYARIADHLKRSVGDDGYAALNARALVRASSGEPVSLLAAVIDILSDLVGEDMARSLLDPDAATDFRTYQLTANGAVLGESLAGYRGITTGVPEAVAVVAGIGLDG
jgi:hypothetical protein